MENHLCPKSMLKQVVQEMPVKTAQFDTHRIPGGRTNKGDVHPVVPENKLFLKGTYTHTDTQTHTHRHTHTFLSTHGQGASSDSEQWPEPHHGTLVT